MEEQPIIPQLVSNTEEGIPIVEHERQEEEGEAEDEGDASGTPTNDMVTTSFMSWIQ